MEQKQQQAANHCVTRREFMVVRCRSGRSAAGLSAINQRGSSAQTGAKGRAQEAEIRKTPQLQPEMEYRGSARLGYGFRQCAWAAIGSASTRCPGLFEGRQLAFR